jgi:hypothetical protein
MRRSASSRETPDLAIKRSSCCSGRHHATITLFNESADARLKNQRGVYNHHSMGILSLMLGRQLLRTRDDARMDDGVERAELLRSRQTPLGPSFFRSMRPPGSRNLLPEVVEDFPISRAAGLNRLVPDAVSVDDVRAEVLEVSRHGALSAGDAPRKSKGRLRVRSPRSEVSYVQSAALLAPK